MRDFQRANYVFWQQFALRSQENWVITHLTSSWNGDSCRPTEKMMDWLAFLGLNGFSAWTWTIWEEVLTMIDSQLANYLDPGCEAPLKRTPCSLIQSPCKQFHASKNSICIYNNPLHCLNVIIACATFLVRWSSSGQNMWAHLEWGYLLVHLLNAMVILCLPFLSALGVIALIGGVERPFFTPRIILQFEK